MKQLEAIKKRLPKRVDIRINSKNILTFRARFSRKGYPDLTKTFPELKLAQAWFDEQNRNALMGIHLPHIKTRCNQLSDVINRYIEEELTIAVRDWEWLHEIPVLMRSKPQPFMELTTSIYVGRLGGLYVLYF